MSNEDGATGPVKSWTGLTLGLIAVAVSAMGWWATRSAAHGASVLAFVCWTAVWSQMHISLRHPLRALLANAAPASGWVVVLTWVGLALLMISLVLRWWP